MSNTAYPVERKVFSSRLPSIEPFLSFSELLWLIVHLHHVSECMNGWWTESDFSLLHGILASLFHRHCISWRKDVHIRRFLLHIATFIIIFLFLDTLVLCELSRGTLLKTIFCASWNLARKCHRFIHSLSDSMALLDIYRFWLSRKNGKVIFMECSKVCHHLISFSRKINKMPGVPIAHVDAHLRRTLEFVRPLGLVFMPKCSATKHMHTSVIQSPSEFFCTTSTCSEPPQRSCRTNRRR